MLCYVLVQLFAFCLWMLFDRDKYILKQFMLAFLIPFNLVSRYNHATILFPHA